jgi:hypothetical protein
MTPLAWASFPLARLFLLAWAGLPLRMTFTHPSSPPHAAKTQFRATPRSGRHHEPFHPDLGVTRHTS